MMGTERQCWKVCWRFADEPQGGDHWRLDSRFDTYAEAEVRYQELRAEKEGGKILVAIEPYWIPA